MKKKLEQLQKWFLDDIFGKDRHPVVKIDFTTDWPSHALDEVETLNCLAYPRYPETKTFLFMYGCASGMDH